MVPCPTSSLTCRYLTRLVEASAHCICRAGCGKAAVESFQLALHLPLPIRYNASLCSASTYSVDFNASGRRKSRNRNPIGQHYTSSRIRTSENPPSRHFVNKRLLVRLLNLRGSIDA